ncbi:MAG: DnaD domain protein, partial [Butyricicoccus sp.]|nr:DnaD domain protein [Butyricicoccus sp.]
SQFIRQGFDAEAVRIAKTRMYDRLGKFSWKYLNGILESWHKKGLHTAAEITAVEPDLRQPVSAKQVQNPSAPPQAAENGGLADWEREWLAEFHAMTKEDDPHGV